GRCRETCLERGALRARCAGGIDVPPPLRSRGCIVFESSSVCRGMCRDSYVSVGPFPASELHNGCTIRVGGLHNQTSSCATSLRMYAWGGVSRRSAHRVNGSGFHGSFHGTVGSAPDRAALRSWHVYCSAPRRQFSSQEESRCSRES